jgi:hypothetical protein
MISNSANSIQECEHTKFQVNKWKDNYIKLQSLYEKHGEIILDTGVLKEYKISCKNICKHISGLPNLLNSRLDKKI